MSLFDWSVILLFATGIFFALLTILWLLLFFIGLKRYRLLMKQRLSKKKRRRKKELRQRRRMKKAYKQRLIGSICYSLLALLLIGSGLFLRHYQQNHLQGEDSEALVQSYFLLAHAKEQLKKIQAGENPQKSLGNLQEITSQLASYGARRASRQLAEDGQTLLNRQYVLLKDLGVNLNGQVLETLQNEPVMASYLSDIENVQTSQKKVFERFQVNEAALKKRR